MAPHELATSVAAARRGEQGAFRTLFEAYVDRVHRVIARVVRDPEEAMDLTQETFVRAFDSLHQLEDDQRFGSWLFRIAMNSALDRQRHLASTNTKLIDRLRTEPEPEARGPLDQVLESEREEAVAGCIAEIEDDAIRQTAQYYYRSPGHDTNEIARLMNVPVSTVTTRLDRFRRMITKRLLRRLTDHLDGGRR